MTAFDFELSYIVLAFFAERGRGTRDEVTYATYKIANRLAKKDFHINCIFAGVPINPQLGDVASPDVDDELRYWLRNGFIREEGPYFVANTLEVYKRYKINEIAKRFMFIPGAFFIRALRKELLV